MANIPAHIFLFGISGGEILIILVAVLLLFGPKKIPEIARMIGRGINEVKKVQREINTEIHRYSADIENEARDVQDKIDRFKKDIVASPENSNAEVDQDQTKASEEEVEDKSGPGSEEEPAQDKREDDLPYPYNEKTGDSP